MFVYLIGAALAVSVLVCALVFAPLVGAVVGLVSTPRSVGPTAAAYTRAVVKWFSQA